MLSIQRMRFVTRIGLVCGILAVPVTLLSWLLFEQLNSTVSFSAKEREGSQLLSMVWETYQTALLEEGEDTPALREATRKLAGADFRSRFVSLGAHEQALDDFLDALASGDLDRQLVSGQATIRAISDFSNMTLDPDLDTYYLMDLVVFRLPLMAARAHHIHDTVSIAGETSGSISPELVKRAIAGEHDFRAALGDVNTSLSLAIEGNKDRSLEPRVQAAAGTMFRASERFSSESSPYVTAVVAGSPSPDAAAILETEEHDAQEGLRALWTVANAEFDRLVEARIDGVVGSARVEFAVVAVLLLLGGVSVFFIARSIARQLSDVSGTLVSLGQGDLNIPIPYQDHRTEIGEMARRFVDLRNRLSEMDQMRRDRERQREETMEVERQKAESVAAFLTRTAKLIEGVTGVAHEVQRASESLSAMAEEANNQAGSVSHAAEETAQSIGGIAQSAEELASAVSSVSSQVAQASQHLEDARQNAETARADVMALASAADSIDGVMSLINEIAEQTNLLALNATIEAARAGEAGRGFAIVAAEVKELAQETAKATGDIQKKVNEIRSATTKTSESFHRIGASIGRGTDMTREVAGAIGSQTSVTGSIAHSVAHAAGSTRQVSSAIGAVRQAAGMTGASAGDLNKLSATLSEQAKALNVEVSRFVNEVRAA